MEFCLNQPLARISGDLRPPVFLARFQNRIFGRCQTHRIDYPLIREIELPVQVEIRPSGDRAVTNGFDQHGPALPILLLDKHL